MISNNDLRLLDLMCQEVESRAIDMAPTYLDWFVVCYGLATDLGEQGRPFFHRICKQYSKGYNPQDNDKMYTYALSHHHGKLHLGSVFQLATNCGVDLKTLREQVAGEEREKKKNFKIPKSPGSPGKFLTCVHEDDVRASTSERGEQETDDDERRVMGSEPFIPLPLLYQGDYDWPGPLGRAAQATTNPTYRDVLLLGTLTAIGASLGRLAQTKYSSRLQYPNLQTFIVAPPASGKGILAFVREITYPLHRRMRQAFEAEQQKYEQAKAVWDRLGRERAQVEMPKAPVQKMFYLPGNVTGTGLLQLLIDNGGRGFIFEVEADTVSTAIKGEYGQWSDALRKCFENEGINYFRRTNQEYRESKNTFLSVLLSGTPGQVAPLIPSAENGLFSRQVFYYMPGVKHFVSQFTDDDRDLTTYFQHLGEDYCRWFDLIRQSGTYELRLSDEQQDAFNRVFDDLLSRSIRVNEAEMNSSVVRLAINVLRMMLIVALLRATEQTFRLIIERGTATGGLSYEPRLMVPLLLGGGAVTDNSVPHHYWIHLTDNDFRQLLAMAEPLYRHGLHVLSLLGRTTVTRRLLSDRDAFYESLPTRFTLDEARGWGEERGLTRKQVEHWVYRWRDKGLLETGDDRGSYLKPSTPDE